MRFLRSISQQSEYQYVAEIPSEGINKPFNINTILSNSFRTQEVPDYKCDSCHRYGGKKTEDILNVNNIFIIRLNILLQNVGDNGEITFYRVPLKINALPTTTLNIAGNRYQLKSSVFNFGESPNSGHYTAYIRQDDGWYCANDTNVSKIQWPRGSKNTYILFYEKK